MSDACMKCFLYLVQVLLCGIDWLELLEATATEAACHSLHSFCRTLASCVCSQQTFLSQVLTYYYYYYSVTYFADPRLRQH